MATITHTGYICTDCLMVSANGTGGGEILPDGREYYAAHAESMDGMNWVGAGPCSDEYGEVCLTRHTAWGECPLATIEFDAGSCDCCGTYLAGARYPAVVIT